MRGAGGGHYLRKPERVGELRVDPNPEGKTVGDSMGQRGRVDSLPFSGIVHQAASRVDVDSAGKAAARRALMDFSRLTS
jgi:hypothetical protein